MGFISLSDLRIEYSPCNLAFLESFQQDCVMKESKMKESKQLMSELLTVSQIFKDRLFRIPDYQRGYAWEERQIEDLIKDITHISGKDHKHYTGSIVVAWNEAAGRFDIVDGQQRITTLIILLNEIKRRNSSRFVEAEHTFINRGNGVFVLELNAESNNFFKEAILDDRKGFTMDIKSLQNLNAAKEFLSRWVDENADRLDSIYHTITEKLGFLCFAPERNEEIGIMFEVINNRGKALSELEKIKNYFIYYSTIHSDGALKDKINSSWGEILKRLNQAGVNRNEDENAFLRNCYIIFHSTNKSKSWYVYDQLKELYPPSIQEGVATNLSQIKRFVDFVHDASRSYAFLWHPTKFTEEYKGSCASEIAMELKKIRCHPTHASILPLYLAAMSYLYERPEEVLTTLKQLEVLNFRVYVLPNPRTSRIDSHQGQLFQWAHNLFWKKGWISEEGYLELMTSEAVSAEEDNFGHLKQRLRDFCLRHCPEEVFVQSLTLDWDESYDYYNWSGLRFFLACYEDYLHKERKESWDIEKILLSNSDAKSEGNANDYLSKEHIWATNNGSDDFANSIHKRRLGNFVLLGLSANIQLSDNDVADKVEFLEKNATTSMRQVNALRKILNSAIELAKSRRSKKTKYYYEDIAKSLIDQRENELIRFALKRWNQPDEKMMRFDRVDSFASSEQGVSKMYFMKSK